MRHNNMRHVVLIALLGGLVGWPVFAQQPQRATPIFATEARTGTFFDRVEALGTLRANETVELTATVTETITAIHFEDGERVNKGDVLVEMTSAEEHAQLEEVRSEIEEAQKQFDRVQSLKSSGAASASLLDQRRRELETAQARLHAVQSRMEDRLITAPFAGVLGLRNVSIGTLVEPGDVITTLDDDSTMKLDFSVPATFIDILKPGLDIIAHARAYGERAFKGHVAAVDSRVDPVTRSIRVRARIPNPEELLKPGLLMSLELLKNPRDAIIIPEEAVMPEGNRTYVLTIDEAQKPPIAERKEVTLGARRPGEVEVLKGLDAGDTVITHGTLKVRHGQPVKIEAMEKNDEPLTELLNQKPVADNPSVEQSE